MTLETAHLEPDWKLGLPWPGTTATYIDTTMIPGVRIGWYTYGIALERNGEIWQLPIANHPALSSLFAGFR